MIVVTVMNYPDRFNENVMCIAWINQVRKHFGEKIDICILTENNLPKPVKNEADKNNVNVLIKGRTNYVDFSGHPDAKKAGHNVSFKLYNLCQIDSPFIFIDADAFILRDAERLFSASKDQGFIAVNHQVIPGQTDHLVEPVLNSGVMVVSDPGLFVWEDFMKILLRDRRFVHPGTDQSLINSRFKESDYDYTHPDVGYEWNSWARYTVWDSENGPTCKGLPVEHAVSINHYWNDAKPWNIDCPIFKNYVDMSIDLGKQR